MSHNLFVVLATPNTSRGLLDSAALQRLGIRVAIVSSSTELNAALGRFQPDVAIIDAAAYPDSRSALIGLAGSSGTPLIAVAIRDSTVRVELLLAGADDCLSDYYVPEELAARVIAIGRRVRSVQREAGGSSLVVGSVRLDQRTRRAQVRGAEVILTAMEFDLLTCFLRHAGETLPRERLLTEVWGYPSGGMSTVTVHVRRLRTKIEADPHHPVLIETVWGIGYRFRADDHAPPAHVEHSATRARSDSP